MAPITPTPAGLLPPTPGASPTTTNVSSSNTPAGLQNSSLNAGADSPSSLADDGTGSGGDSGGDGDTTAQSQQTNPNSNVILGSENYLNPGAAGTGANIGVGTISQSNVALPPKAASVVSNVLDSTASGDPAAIHSSTQALLNVAGSDEFSGMSVQMIIQKVLMEAYDGTQKDLNTIAKRYQFFNTVKTNIRNEISKVQAALANASDGSLTFSATPTTANLNPTMDGQVDTSPKPGFNPLAPIDGTSSDPSLGGPGVSNGVILDKNTLNAYAKKLDGDLDTAGDNASEQQTKLQAITSQQQQLLNIITQLIKQWSDTSMSIIHNI